MKQIDENTRVENHYLSYTNLRSTEEYLEQMAAGGWMLTEVTGRTKYKFTKCEPKQLRFCVGLFYEGSTYDTHVIDTNRDYIAYCESVGWKFVCGFGTVDLFCTADLDVPEIDSDSKIQLSYIHKQMKPMTIYMSAFFLFLAAFQIIMALTFNLNQTEKMSLAFTNVILMFVVIGISMLSLVSYLSWYRKAKRAAENGDSLPAQKKTSFKAAKLFLLVFACVHCGVLAWTGVVFRDKLNFLIIPVWLMILILLTVSTKLVEYSEKKKLGRKKMKLLTLFVEPLVFCGILIGIAVAVVILVGSENKRTKDAPHFTNTAVFTKDGETLSTYREQYTSEGAFLIRSYSFHLIGESKEESIISWDFYVMETLMPAIHERLLRESGSPSGFHYGGIVFDQINATSLTEFETGDVTVLVSNRTEKLEYLLYDADTIVTLRTQEVLTKEQFAEIVGTLMKQ